MSAGNDPQQAGDAKRVALASGQRSVAIDGPANHSVINTGKLTINLSSKRLMGTMLAGLAILVAVAVIGVQKQEKSAKAILEKQDELKDVNKQLLAAIAPKPLADGQTKPGPLPPEIIEKAKLLLQQGNAEQRVLGMIALKQHHEANRIIQEMKVQPGNPIDEAFLLLMLEGDNWYQAGEFDKAIGPYEQALAIRPEDFRARNGVLLARASRDWAISLITSVARSKSPKGR